MTKIAEAATLQGNPRPGGIEVAEFKALGSKGVNLLSHFLWRILRSSSHHGTQQVLAPMVGAEAGDPPNSIKNPLSDLRDVGSGKATENTHSVTKTSASCEFEGVSSTDLAT